MRLAELVSTGTELLNGSRLNTHARRLAQVLAPLGYALVRDTTVVDDARQIEDAVRQALSRVDLVFVTGGLGPTTDDMTRDCIAAVLGRRVVLDEAYSKLLERWYGKAGRPYTESARRQALVVEGAKTLSNPVGVAPGEHMQVDDRNLFVLPGPPREFEAILERHVIPFLAARDPVPSLRAERILMLAGIGESDVETLLEEAGFAPEGIGLGTCSRPGELELRVQTESGADVEAAARTLLSLLGSRVYARDRSSLEEVVIRELAARNASLGSIEVGSAGRLSQGLASCPEAGGHYRGGAVVVSPECLVQEFAISRELLGAHGAASEPVACALAECARIRFDATYGLAVGGMVVLEDEAGERHAGETWVAVARPAGVQGWKVRMPGDPEFRQVRTAKYALFRLLRTLREAR